MKSPFLIFLPAALGAAGIYLLVQPGQTEDLLVEAPVPDGRYGGENPWGEREWGGTRSFQESFREEDPVLAPVPSSEHPSSSTASARRNLRSREAARPAPPRSPAMNPGSGDFAERRQHTRGDLERRAAQVEVEANRELERLIPVLGLSEAQQQRIFAVLVRHSAAFDPVMRVETAGETVFPEDDSYAGATKDEELYAALDDEQQVVMEEYYEDQAAWWQDVVEQLVPDSAIPGLAGSEPPIMMADERPLDGEGGGKDVTGTVRPPSP